jgi:hypothetical protein
MSRVVFLVCGGVAVYFLSICSVKITMKCVCG